MRLTNSIREKILESVIKSRFETEEADLLKREQALALEVYNLVYSKAERDLMEALPEGFLPLAGDVQVNCGVRLNLNLKGVVRVAKKDCDRFGRYLKVEVPAKKKRLHSKLHKFSRDASGVTSEKRRLTHATRQTLYSFTTDTALVKAWPEVRGFIPKPPKKTLPAVVPEKLTKELRLG